MKEYAGRFVSGIRRLDKMDSEILIYGAGNKIDELLQNAIDVHCHSYPEISLDLRMRVEDSEAVRIAQGMGMRGIVFKSHFWPTRGAGPKFFNLHSFTCFLYLICV